MDQFNLQAANHFVNEIKNLPEIYEISIIDTRCNGDEFKVNDQLIFLDLNKENQPNFYSYILRSEELGVNPDELEQCLKYFHVMRVNEFRRDSGYYRFRVDVGFGVNAGYGYDINHGHNISDKVKSRSVNNYDYRFTVSSIINENWFEYEGD